MRKIQNWFYCLIILAACTTSAMVFAQLSETQIKEPIVIAQNASASLSNISTNTQNLRLGIVNTKKCLEESKLGKQEQANFEKMKHQMEGVLQDKERALEEIESKLNDDDYMDSVSEETENELKRKRRTIRSEGMQLQNQFMQTLQQANVKIIQKLADTISKASAQVAQDNLNGKQPLDVVLTDEACTFYNPRLDVSDQIIAKMNLLFDAEQKETAAKPR